MKLSTTKTIMKCMGATLAICSAVAMAEGSKMMSSPTKKSMKKTMNKVADVVENVAGMF